MNARWNEIFNTYGIKEEIENLFYKTKGPRIEQSSHAIESIDWYLSSYKEDKPWQVLAKSK